MTAKPTSLPKMTREVIENILRREDISRVAWFEVRELCHSALRSHTLEQRVAELERERDAYAELAAGKCVIQKVIDELGPQTLTSVARFKELEAAEARAAAAEKDAERWNELLMHLSGGRDPHGNECFVVEVPDPPTGVSIMKGSVAGHFSAAIDAAIESRAALAAIKR